MRSLLLLCMFSGLAFAGDIVHFTPNDSEFVSEVVVRNASNNKETVNFKAYATIDGLSQQLEYTVDLNPGETKLLSGTDFPLWPSHLWYEKTNLVNVAARYRRAVGGNAVTVGGGEQTGKIFRYSYLDPNDFWMGLALVSQEPETTVVLRQFDGSGQRLSEHQVAANLGFRERALKVISTLGLRNDPMSYLEVVADKPICAMLLFGTHPSDGTSVMSVAQPEKVYNDRIVVGFSGGVAGFSGTVTLSEGKLMVEDKIVPLADDTIRTELLASGAATHEIPVAEPPCCDYYFYNLEIIDGPNRNHFTISDVDLEDKNPQAIAGLEMIKKVYRLAEEVLGTEVFRPGALSNLDAQ